MTKTMEATIEADPKLPIIRMTREFAATPEQLFRAHTDPELLRMAGAFAGGAVDVDRAAGVGQGAADVAEHHGQPEPPGSFGTLR